MYEKCKKCFWYFSIRDHTGHVWGRACYHAIDGLLYDRDIQPTEDCFAERRKRVQLDLSTMDFRDILKTLTKEVSPNNNKET